MQLSNNRSLLFQSFVFILVCSVALMFSTQSNAGIIDKVTGAAELVPKDIFKPMKPSQAPEIYGPTPINAQLGNQGLSIGIRKNGTVSTLSWPRQSMWDQVKFHTVSRDKKHWGADPNAGLFLGIVPFKNGNKGEPTLLRSDDWSTSQEYQSSLNDVLKTVYKNEDLGIKVTVKDLIPINANVTTGEDGDKGTYTGDNSKTLRGDALIRRAKVEYLSSSSDVDQVRLFSYANFVLVNNHHPYVPTNDWAETFKHQDAHYFHNDICTEEVLWGLGGCNEWREAPDAMFFLNKGRNGNNDIVTTMAFGEPDPKPDKDNDGNGAYDYQVGLDPHRSNCKPTDPISCAGNLGIDLADPSKGKGAHYDFLDDGELNGFDNHCPNAEWCYTHRDFAPSVGLLSDKLDPAKAEKKHVVFTAANNQDEAEDVLEEARTIAQNNFKKAITEKENWFKHLLDGAPIPDKQRANEEITGLAKRALVTLIQDYDPRSGAIVASIARQSPYAEDWPRDGAYFNYVLDHKLGLHDWVKKRNLDYYAPLQQKKDKGLLDKALSGNKQPLVPVGNWAMNYYGNGKIGGVIPWEVDETAYMVWAFWDHYEATKDKQYLRDIYPTLKRSADFLKNFKDEDNNLQKAAHEDDHFTKSQTIVGANTTWLAMKSAEKAARALGKTSDADQYEARKEELGKAINDILWNTEKQAWGQDHWGNPEVGWPTQFRSWDNSRMQKHLESNWDKVKRTFQQPSGKDTKVSGGGIGENKEIVMGLYETKFLISLAKGWEGKPQKMDKVKSGLNWVADKWATEGTNIMGEVWMKCTDESRCKEQDDIVSTVSQPHAWEQALFYIGATEAYPVNKIGQSGSPGYPGYPGYGF